MNENNFLPPETNFRQRILVVEDDPMIRRLNTKVLICSGYLVDAAEDGAVAWAAIQQESYDLIVTDHDMPKMTGVDLLRSLHEARLALPVIMATGSFPGEELERQPWLKVGVTLLKPYGLDDLLAAVNHVLCAASTGEFAPPPHWRSSHAPTHQGSRLPAQPSMTADRLNHPNLINQQITE